MAALNTGRGGESTHYALAHRSYLHRSHSRMRASICQMHGTEPCLLCVYCSPFINSCGEKMKTTRTGVDQVTRMGVGQPVRRSAAMPATRSPGGSMRWGWGPAQRIRAPALVSFSRIRKDLRCLYVRTKQHAMVYLLCLRMTILLVACFCVSCVHTLAPQNNITTEAIARQASRPPHSPVLDDLGSSSSMPAFP